MPYGTVLVDTIIPTANLSVSSNVAVQGNVTVTNVDLSEGRLYPLLSTSAVTLASAGLPASLATGLPSWVTRINVVFYNISLTGTSRSLIQLGTGSTPVYQTTGYFSVSDNYTGTPGPVANTTAGFVIGSASTAAYLFHGIYEMILVPGTNTWIGQMQGQTNGTDVLSGGGTVTLPGTLTAVRITSLNGTDTFDNGQVCVFYE